jgi:hypothetical protein
MLGKAVDCTSVAGIGYVQANMTGLGPGWAGSHTRVWDGSGRTGSGQRPADSERSSGLVRVTLRNDSASLNANDSAQFAPCVYANTVARICGSIGGRL